MRKKMNDKGFTLVELIVVLVILAILAAILVPALLGYIDRAREQQIVLNAKSALTAAQAEFSSMYGKGDYSLDSDEITRIKNTADLPDTATSLIVVTKEPLSASNVNNHDSYKIIGCSYTENGKTLVFDGTSWDKDNKLPDGPKHNIISS